MKTVLLAIALVIPYAAQAELKAVQVLAGSFSTCALFDNGKVKCWGDGYYGATGSGNRGATGDNSGEMGDNLPFVDLGKNVTVKSLFGTYYSVCAVLKDGAAKCFGYGYYGALASGNTSDVGYDITQMGDKLPKAQLGKVPAIIQADGGAGHLCAVFENKKVKCWGDNSSGQLGLGDMNQRGNSTTTVGDQILYVDLGTVSKVHKVTAGNSHSCALFENGKIKCWGGNSNGELGLGDTNFRGSLPNQMGDKLPFVNLGNEVAIDVTAGELMTCALFKNGKVKCWGLGQSGRTGYGDQQSRGVKPTDMGDNLAWVNLVEGLPAKSIEAEGSSVCAGLLNGTMKCWGANFYGQLGYDDITDKGDEPNETGDGLDFVYLGRNASVVSFSRSPNTTCAVINMKGEYRGLKCWGYANYGGLGYESQKNWGAASGDMINLPFINLGN